MDSCYGVQLASNVYINWQKLQDKEKSKLYTKTKWNGAKGELPTPLMDLFSSNIEIQKHNTRQRYDPHISCQIASYIWIPELWLTLPDSINKARTMAWFKENVNQDFTKIINWSTYHLVK